MDREHADKLTTNPVTGKQYQLLFDTVINVNMLLLDPQTQDGRPTFPYSVNVEPVVPTLNQMSCQERIDHRNAHLHDDGNEAAKDRLDNQRAVEQ